MPVPINYRQQGEMAIKSYSYTDIAEGTGVVKFYAVNSEDNGTKDYHLTTQTPHSNDVLTKGATTGAGDEKILDLDFDIIFNQPQNLKGDFIASVSWIAGHETIANCQGTSWIIMKVRHWDGTTETDLCSITKSKVLTTPSLEIHSETALVKANLATSKHFKKGDTLRITIEGWANRVTTAHYMAILHDPKDRTMTNGNEYEYDGGAAAITDPPETTQSYFLVPFVLDL